MASVADFETQLVTAFEPTWAWVTTGTRAKSDYVDHADRMPAAVSGWPLYQIRTGVARVAVRDSNTTLEQVSTEVQLFYGITAVGSPLGTITEATVRAKIHAVQSEMLDPLQWQGLAAVHGVETAPEMEILREGRVMSTLISVACTLNP